MGKGLLYLSFKKYMVPEVQFDFDLSSFFSWIVAGTVVLIIASAFNKGHKLQEEQALTI
jgi:multisubunit Na+/H+ antiporter MnhB subunit